jgi:DNA replication protein DnaC
LTDIPCLIINDAGAENLLNDFGTHRNIISDILILRYRAFQKRGLKTYLTSNMTWKAINEHYGDRLEDRFREMFYKVEIVGESKR